MGNRCSLDRAHLVFMVLATWRAQNQGKLIIGLQNPEERPEKATVRTHVSADVRQLSPGDLAGYAL